MDTFVPEDSERDDNDYHKQVRAQALLPNHTADDREFTTEEIRITVKSMNKKAPGDDGITGDIYNYAFKTLPKFITSVQRLLETWDIANEMEDSLLIPIIKPGKENSYDVTKCRPISLLNVGGKVLGKLMINRINHHVFISEYTSKNQYGFMPQTSTTNAAMAVKEYVEEGFRSEVLVSLDVEGVFNSAWWLNILNVSKIADAPGTY